MAVINASIALEKTLAWRLATYGTAAALVSLWPDRMIGREVSSDKVSATFARSIAGIGTETLCSGRAPAVR